MAIGEATAGGHESPWRGPRQQADRLRISPLFALMAKSCAHASTSRGARPTAGPRAFALISARFAKAPRVRTSARSGVHRGCDSLSHGKATPRRNRRIARGAPRVGREALRQIATYSASTRDNWPHPRGRIGGAPARSHSPREAEKERRGRAGARPRRGSAISASLAVVEDRTAGLEAGAHLLHVARGENARVAAAAGRRRGFFTSSVRLGTVPLAQTWTLLTRLPPCSSGPRGS